jgi:hypothetical protein
MDLHNSFSQHKTATTGQTYSIYLYKHSTTAKVELVVQIPVTNKDNVARMMSSAFMTPQKKTGRTSANVTTRAKAVDLVSL